MRHLRSIRGGGFTLLEILLAISIVALLMGLLLPVLSKGRREAKRAATESTIEGLHRALVAYKSHKGHFPLLPDKDTVLNDGDPGYYPAVCAAQGADATGGEHNRDLLKVLKQEVSLSFGASQYRDDDLMDDFGTPLVVRFLLVPLDPTRPDQGWEEVVRIWSYGPDRKNGVVAAPNYAYQGGPAYDAAEDAAVLSSPLAGCDDIVSWK